MYGGDVHETVARAMEAARRVIGPWEDAGGDRMLPIDRVDVGDESFEPALAGFGVRQLDQIDLVAEIPATQRRLPSEALDDCTDQQPLRVEDLRVGPEDIARLLR